MKAALLYIAVRIGFIALFYFIGRTYAVQAGLLEVYQMLIFGALAVGLYLSKAE